MRDDDTFGFWRCKHTRDTSTRDGIVEHGGGGWWWDPCRSAEWGARWSWGAKWRIDGFGLQLKIGVCKLEIGTG